MSSQLSSITISNHRFASDTSGSKGSSDGSCSPASLCTAYFPLIMVFISGIGFSFQGLLQKLLSEDNFHATFLAVILRGATQASTMYSMILFSGSACCNGGTKKKLEPLLGSTTYTTKILFLRGFFGFLGIGLAFLTFDRLPLGDASVLLTLGPFFAAILGAVVLGEPWHASEMLATVLSLVGACLVAKPSAIFGEHFESQPLWSSHYHGHSSDTAAASAGLGMIRLLANATGTNGTATDPSTDMNSTGATASLNVVGVFCGLSSSFCSGLCFMMLRILGTTARVNWKNVGVIQGLSQFFGALPCLFLFNQLSTHHPSLALPVFHSSATALPSLYAVTETQWGMLVACAFVGTISQGIMTIGLQRVKSATGTAMRMSDVVSSFILQAAITKDAVDLLSVVGATLVMISTAIIVVYSKQNTAATTSATAKTQNVGRRTGGSGGGEGGGDDNDDASESDIEMHHLSVGTTASDVSSSMLSGFSFDSGALALGGAGRKHGPGGGAAQKQRPSPAFNILRRHNNVYVHLPQTDSSGSRNGAGSVNSGNAVDEDGGDDSSPFDSPGGGGGGGQRRRPYRDCDDDDDDNDDDIGKFKRRGDVEDGRLDDMNDNRHQAYPHGSSSNCSPSAGAGTGGQRNPMHTAVLGQGAGQGQARRLSTNPFDDDEEDVEAAVNPESSVSAAAAAVKPPLRTPTSSAAAPHTPAPTAGPNAAGGIDDDDDDDDDVFSVSPAYKIVPSTSLSHSAAMGGKGNSSNGSGSGIIPLSPHAKTNGSSNATASSSSSSSSSGGGALEKLLMQASRNGNGSGRRITNGNSSATAAPADDDDDDDDAAFFSCRDGHPTALTALEQSILSRVGAAGNVAGNVAGTSGRSTE